MRPSFPGALFIKKEMIVVISSGVILAERWFEMFSGILGRFWFKKNSLAFGSRFLC